MNILYGIAGEGLGHATRSKVIIEHLLKKNHQVRIITSNKAYNFLQKIFPNIIKKIDGFTLSIENNEVNIPKSISQNIFSIPQKLIKNSKVFLSPFEDFKPDLVISDFESLVYLYAKTHNLPIIAIDNIHIISRAKIEYPKNQKNSFLFTKAIVSSKLPACDNYLISTFFDTKTNSKNTKLIPPIIRNEIINATPSYEDHILVYLSGKTYPRLVEILEKIPEKFIAYGFNKNEKNKNILFKDFSNEGFIEDLSKSKAVISTSGFSLMTESIFLKKPFFAIPLKNQFEQILNAHYLKKLSFGDYKMELEEKHINSFLKNQNIYINALNNYKQNSNEILFKNLEKLLK
jgi:uncharacterized protein (TIGR00661 family)